MAMRILILASCLLYLHLTIINVQADDTALCELVEKRDYKCREYEVQTQDGYILTLHRMTKGHWDAKPNGNVTDSHKIPVLLQHGLTMDGLTWLLLPPGRGLGWVLADMGYDVWIANARGTKWSSRHTSLNPNTRQYWDWSWDELMNNDMQTNVNKVYEEAEQKMYYVGHSLGTLVCLAALSRGKMLDKLRAVGLLTPIAHMLNMRSPPGRIAASMFTADEGYWIGAGKFDAKSGAGANLISLVCRNPLANCYLSMAPVTGPNCCLDSSTMALFYDQELQPSSMKNMAHLAQMIRTGDIRMFNYGSPFLNQQHYGSLIPPAYDMSRIPPNFPIYMGYGGEDYLSSTLDVLWLIKRDLANHQQDKLLAQFIPQYAHMDFVMGTSAKQLVYDPMIAFFRRN